MGEKQRKMYELGIQQNLLFIFVLGFIFALFEGRPKRRTPKNFLVLI